MKENNEQMIRQTYVKLQEYLRNIETNEEYKKLLKFQAKFTAYSVNNTVLIMLSKPNATYVAGYGAWMKMHRYVRRGEKAIKIFAPCAYRVYDDDRKDYVEQINGYRLANVFDISQTDGDDSAIPEVVRGLENEGTITPELFQQLIDTCPVTVTFVDNMRAKGSYNSGSQCIKIHSGYSLAQQTKTLLHEWAHHLCSEQKINVENAVEECLVESVAFVVAERIKLNTLDYAIPYIASWCKDPAIMQRITSNVQRLSRLILEQLRLSQPDDKTLKSDRSEKVGVIDD